MIPGLAMPMLIGGRAATTWNPADKSPNIVLSGGNLSVTNASGTNNDAVVRAILSKASSGKFVWAITPTGGVSIEPGFATAAASLTSFLGGTSASVGYNTSGFIATSSGNTTGLTAASAGDEIMFAADLAALKFWVLINGTSISGNPSAGTGGSTLPSGAIFPAVDAYNSNTVSTANFGKTPFAFSAPSGFSAWL